MTKILAHPAVGGESLDLYFRAMRPIFYFWWFLGCLPAVYKDSPPSYVSCFRKEALKYPFRWAISIIYTFSVYGMTSSAVFVYSSFTFETDEARKHVDGSCSNFDRDLFIYHAMLYNATQFLIPLTHWSNIGGLCGYFRHWKAFQQHYRKSTGESLVPQRKWRIFGAILFIVLSMVSLLSLKMIGKSNLWEMSTMILMYGRITSNDSLWYLLCSSLTLSGRQLLNDYKRDLRKISDEGSGYQKLEAYIGLWLELSDLIRETGRVLTLNFIVHLTNQFVTMTLGTYSIVYLMSCGSVTSVVFMASWMLFGLCLLWVMVNSAHSAADQSGGVFLRELRNLHATNKNKDILYQIETFIEAIVVDPPNINLGGFFVVNRKTVSQVFGTLVTYVIVLLQFGTVDNDYSQPSSPNSTDH